MASKHSFTAFLFIGLVMAVMTGCADPRPSDVPGTIKPGSIQEVDSRSRGGGGGGASGDPIDRIGVVPLTGSVKPTIPVIKPPEIIQIWVYSRKSRNGMAIRHGFWIDAVKRPFSWGVDDEMQQGRVELSNLSNMRLDAYGRVVVDATAALQPPQADVDGMRSMAASFPWRQDGQDRNLVRTTVIDATSGRATSFQAPAPPTMSPNSAPSVNDIETALREARRQLQQPPPKTPSAAGVPSTGP